MTLGKTEDEDRGLTVRQLGMLFLALVAVCAVFFTLGFLVGHRSRASSAGPVSQQVTPAGDVPAIVNPPLQQEHLSSEGNGAPSAPEAVRRSTSTDNSPGPLTTAPNSPTAAPVAGTRLPANPAPPTGMQPGSGATVQVAASRTEQDARAMVRLLRGRGYAAYLMTPAEAHAADGLYRVQVGPFPSREAAERVLKKLTEEGFKPFIRR